MGRPPYSTNWDGLVARTTPEPNTGCWLLVDGANHDSYGHAWVDGWVGKAHRVVLSIKLGRAIRSDRMALHRCDVKCCVNPDHLYEGTVRQNARDRVARSPTLRANMSRSVKRAWADARARGQRAASGVLP